MTVELLIELAWKSCLYAAISLAVLRLLRSRTASERSAIAAAGLLALLLLPVGIAFFPEIEIAAPESVSAVLRDAAPLTSQGGAAIPGQDAGLVAKLPWASIILTLYLLPAALLLAGLLAGIARLWDVRGRADVVEDPRWLAALASAQSRLKLKHGTALLVSDELNSPISWGSIRPIIIVDREAMSRTAQAEVIIAHELAHVTRLDWATLLMGRLVVCIFWFNPLVWLLALQSHQLSEESADDAVLRARIPSVDYADVLVNAVRHANSAHFLPANGVAPGRSSLARRVENVLDEKRSRAAARLRWVALTLLFATTLNIAVSAAVPSLVGRLQYVKDAGDRATARLARLSSPQSRQLAIAIRSKSWEARAVAGDTRFGEQQAIDPLLIALSDDEAVVRKIAVWGLSEMGPLARASAEGPVTRLLDDPSPDVRAAATGALGDFSSVTRAGEVALMLSDPDRYVRRRAAHALGDLKVPYTRAALLRAQTDPDLLVRREASWALSEIDQTEPIDGT